MHLQCHRYSEGSMCLRIIPYVNFTLRLGRVTTLGVCMPSSDKWGGGFISLYAYVALAGKLTINLASFRIVQSARL